MNGQLIEPIRGARVLKLPVFRDGRGALNFAQEPEQIPFIPVRVFLLYDLVVGTARGGHAHKEQEQYVICVHGSCVVELDDGTGKASVTLTQPEDAVYVPAMVWMTITPQDESTAILVLASRRYDPDDYIHQYAEFQRSPLRRH